MVQNYQIALYENGVRTQYTLTVDHDSPKYQQLLELYGQMPIAINVILNQDIVQKQKLEGFPEWHIFIQDKQQQTSATPQTT
mgnify:FL=1